MDYSQKRTELVGKGGILNSLFLAIAPVLFYVCVKEAYCTCMFIAIVLLCNKLLISGKKMSIKGFAVIAILIALLTGGIYYHHQFHANGNNQEVAQEQKQEEKEEEAKEEQEEEQKQEDQDQQNQGKVKGENKGSDEAIVITKNANDSKKAPAVGGVKDQSKKEQTFKDNTNAEQNKESQEREQKDIENGKTVTKQKDHETTSDYKEGLEDKNEGAKEAVINPENGKEVKDNNGPTYGPTHIDIPTQEETHTSSNNNNNEVKVENADKEEAIPEVKPVEEVQEESKDELAKLFEEENKKTTKTIEEKPATKVDNEDKVETKTSDTKAVVEEEIVIEEVKGNVEVVEVVEEKTNTTAPEVQETKVEVKKFESVSISAIDGNSAMVNSTIQYRVNGDVAKIEGLDGLSYSMNNGVLTIQTGAEATAVYFEVTGQDGSVAVAEFTVNGFNR